MGAHHRILVADDDRDAAHALAELLRLEGYAADAAVGERETSIRLDTDDYCIGFLDVSLPARSDVASFLEMRRRQASMRSYLMTGYSIGQLLQQLVKSNSVQMLGDEIRQEQVLAAVREAGNDGIILFGAQKPNTGARLHDLLSSSEYVVAHATDAAEAHAQIEERRVHVLILDLGARIVDAAGIYAALQAEGRARPTIILSSGQRTALEDAPITGIITKPYNPKLLLEQIDRLAA